MDETLLAILACPKCRGTLEPLKRDEASGLACGSCAVVYPILEDIPVLLIEEAIPRQDWDTGKNAARAESL